MRGQKRVKDARERAGDRASIFLQRRMDCRVKPGNEGVKCRRLIFSTRSPRRRGRGASERTYSTLNALFFETLDKPDHVALFSLRHLELRQGRGGMTEEHVPVALADAHTSVGNHH